MLTVDGKEFSQEIRLVSDPNLPVLNDLTSPEEEAMDEGDDEEEEEEQDSPIRKIID